MTIPAINEELDLERMHPIWSAKYQIQQAERELETLEQNEQALAEERLSLIRKSDTEAPGTRSRLEKIEAEILRLQTCQRLEQDQITALTGELPGIRQAAQEKANELEALEERKNLALIEIEGINGQLASLLNADLAQELIDLMEARGKLAKEFKGIPWLIADVRSYFHLQPGIQAVDVPKLPGHIRTLIAVLSK